ncbi:MAG: hypothetical protein GW833_00315 [Desulfuromonadales bacterium]|nr:hypothetical protein [Desulfuromonadales bacterium]
MERDALRQIFTTIAEKKVLVVGDLMLDMYIWGKTSRISPEAPVPVVEVERDELRLGGAGNVVNNLLSLGCRVAVASVVGADDDGFAFKREGPRLGVVRIGRKSGKTDEIGQRRLHWQRRPQVGRRCLVSGQVIHIAASTERDRCG